MDTGEGMDDQPGANLAFRMNLHPGNCHHTSISEKMNTDQKLTNYGDLDAVSPAPKSITDHHPGSEFQQRGYPMAEESLVLRPHPISHAFAAKVCTNHFKHVNSLVRVTRCSQGPEDAPRPWQIPLRCNRLGGHLPKFRKPPL